MLVWLGINRERPKTLAGEIKALLRKKRKKT